MAASIWTPGTLTAPVLPAVAPVQFVKGTAALPGITFVADADTGVWSQADGFINFACNGINVLTIDPSGNVTVNKLITAPELDIASAATTNIGGVLSNTLRITGVANISSFGTTYRGPLFVRFAGALILSHSATLLLPGGAAITTAAGDTCVVTPKATAGVSDGWEVVSYQRASFAPPAGGFALSGANTDITSLSGITSINGGQLAGMRNRIINGAMNIAQRVSLVCTSGVSGFGGPDRFKAENSAGAGGQFTQSAGTLTANGIAMPSVLQTVNTAIVDITTIKYWLGINQLIEGFNCHDLKTKSSVVSFWFNASVAGNYTVALRDGLSTNSFLSTIVAVANVPQKVIVAIPPTLATSSMPNTSVLGLHLTIGALNAATFQSAVVNSWTVGSFIAAVGFVNWGLTVGATIAIAELHLEEGTAATPLERRSFGTEFALCQRYYEVVPTTIGNQTPLYTPFYYKVNKRVTPTLVITPALTLGGALGVGSIPAYGFRLEAVTTAAPTDQIVTANAEL